MKHLLHLAAALALLGCEAPNFSFETEGLPCSIPAEVKEAVKEPSSKGCWRLHAKPGHGFTQTDPGLVACNLGVECIIAVPGETFWVLGQGRTTSDVEDVDCAEVCP